VGRGHGGALAGTSQALGTRDGDDGLRVALGAHAADDVRVARLQRAVELELLLLGPLAPLLHVLRSGGGGRGSSSLGRPPALAAAHVARPVLRLDLLQLLGPARRHPSDTRGQSAPAPDVAPHLGAALLFTKVRLLHTHHLGFVLGLGFLCSLKRTVAQHA
jgi:hypothetical protein